MSKIQHKSYSNVKTEGIMEQAIIREENAIEAEIESVKALEMHYAEEFEYAEGILPLLPEESTKPSYTTRMKTVTISPESIVVMRKNKLRMYFIIQTRHFKVEKEIVDSGSYTLPQVVGLRIFLDDYNSFVTPLKFDRQVGSYFSIQNTSYGTMIEVDGQLSGIYNPSTKIPENHELQPSWIITPFINRIEGKFTNLKILVLNQVNSKVIKIPSQNMFPELDTLIINNCPKAKTITSLSNPEKDKWIQTLYLNSLPFVGEIIFPYINNIRNLGLNYVGYRSAKNLKLGFFINDNALNELNLDNIRSLKLNGTPIEKISISTYSSELFIDVLYCPRLSEVDIHADLLFDSKLSFDDCKLLEHIELYDINFTKTNLNITRCPKIKFPEAVLKDYLI